MSTSHGAVYEPINIGDVEIRNRIARTAHGVRLDWVNKSDRLLAYHVARAKGGVGLSILGIAGVHPTCANEIPITSDDIVADYQKLSKELHSHGMKVFQQLWHGGAVRPNSLGGPPWSAGTIPNPALGVNPQPMSKGMIDEVVEAFAAAARRAKEGGLDGVELHAAHGYLIHQFLSPASNDRTDEYGGSFENRLRFLREIIDAMRAEVGTRFVVGVRLSASEVVEHGMTIADTRRVATEIEPLLDFIDISYAGYYRPELMAANHDHPLGYQLDSAREITTALSVPSIVTGRIMTIDLAADTIENGTADMVSMVRAMIADPNLLVKNQTGRAAEVRPCTGSNQGCLSNLTNNFHCVVNPSAGRELSVPEAIEPAKHRRRVLVAGGGPAGLEAARAAALRGHEVTVMEMKRFLGGQVVIAAKAPYRSDYQAITQWLADELKRMKVKVRLYTPVDPDVVGELAPDVLIVATGSGPRHDLRQVFRPVGPIPGATLPHVYNSWDLFGVGGRAEVGSRAVVYDDVGSYEPLSVADALLAQGVHVTYVTRFPQVAANLPVQPEVMGSILKRLSAGGIEIITAASIKSITPDEVELEIAGNFVHRAADTVVFVGVNDSNNDLADPELLGDFAGEVHLIGDANGSRTLAAAIHGGGAIGRSL